MGHGFSVVLYGVYYGSLAPWSLQGRERERERAREGEGEGERERARGVICPLLVEEHSLGGVPQTVSTVLDPPQVQNSNNSHAGCLVYRFIKNNDKCAASPARSPAPVLYAYPTGF